MNKTRMLVAGLFAATAFASTSAMADCKTLLAAIDTAQGLTTTPAKKGVTVFSSLQAAANIAGAAKTGGYGLPMWVTVVDETGIVCAVATSKSADAGDSFTTWGRQSTGANGLVWGTSFSQVEKTSGTNASANGASNSQWLASRVISAQKANTANSLSVNGYSISTANLYTAVQPGNSLYGLQHSNPVDASITYLGLGKAFGTSKDPMVNKRPGGINVFGGGLALYSGSTKVGAVGVSGDTSCRDHAFAWEVRKALKLDGNTVGITTANADAGGASQTKLSGAAKGDEMIFTGTGGYWDAWSHPMCPNTQTGAWSVTAP